MRRSEFEFRTPLHDVLQIKLMQHIQRSAAEQPYTEIFAPRRLLPQTELLRFFVVPTEILSPFWRAYIPYNNLLPDSVDSVVRDGVDVSSHSSLTRDARFASASKNHPNSPTPAPAMAAIHAPFAVVILLSVF